jgi:hypothetical protein
MRFLQYIVEREKERGTLNVFDIDETLFYTTAKILVKKNGKKVRELDNQQFNTYKLKPGEEYDFGQFRDAEHFAKTSVPIDRMFKKAKAIIRNQKGISKTILLTARSDFNDREKFLQTFRDYDFPIDDVHVERAGNLDKLKKGGSYPALNKMVVLRRYIKTGNYNRIRVYDDSERNLAAILKLKDIHPEIEVEAWLVNHDGYVTKFNG